MLAELLVLMTVPLMFELFALRIVFFIVQLKHAAACCLDSTYFQGV